MDPINPVAGNPMSVGSFPKTPTIPNSNPQIPKDSHWITILAMGLFVIASLAVVAFLYYQNQQLKSMLANYQTPLASPTPSASQAPNGDLVNWKTYTNSTYKYSVKIPTDWEAIRQSGDDSVISIRPIGASNIPVIFNSQSNKNNLSLNTWIDNQLGKNYPREIKKLNSYDAVFVHNTTSPYEFDVYYLTNGSVVYELSGSTLNNDQLQIFDQILSTFKFLGVPTASPTTTSKPSSTPISY